MLTNSNNLELCTLYIIMYCIYNYVHYLIPRWKLARLVDSCQRIVKNLSVSLLDKTLHRKLYNNIAKYFYCYLKQDIWTIKGNKLDMLTHSFRDMYKKLLSENKNKHWNMKSSQREVWTSLSNCSLALWSGTCSTCPALCWRAISADGKSKPPTTFLTLRSPYTGDYGPEKAYVEQNNFLLEQLLCTV